MNAVNKYSRFHWEEQRMKQYRVGIIGCGARSVAHINGWRGVPGVDVVAVADPIAERRNGVADRFGILERYDGHEAMLASVHLDCISLATKPSVREIAIRSAVEHDVRGILCEKPMAMSLPEYDRILAACRERAVVFVANHQLRHLADWQHLARACAMGQLGTIERIEVTSYGNLLAQGTHLLDMLLQFAGDQPPEWVIAQAVGWDDQAGHPAPELSVAHFRFPNGIVAYALLGAAAPRLRVNSATWYRFQLRVSGTAGHGEVNLFEGARIWTDGQSTWETWPDRWDNPADLDRAQSALSESVIRAIEDPTYQPPARGEIARIGFEMLEAICASAQNRAIVRWPLPRWTTSPLLSLRPGEAGEAEATAKTEVSCV